MRHKPRLSRSEVLELRKRFTKRPQRKGTCAYCLEDGWVEADHVEPVSRGGGDEEENIAFVYRSCNRSKRNRFLVEWVMSDACRAVGVRAKVELYGQDWLGIVLFGRVCHVCSRLARCKRLTAAHIPLRVNVCSDCREGWIAKYGLRVCSPMTIQSPGV